MAAIGLIPTHAGKTCRSGGRGPSTKAHPHSRGENDTLARHPGQPMGSSPLTRGKRAGSHGGYLSERLIPTHAGKTCRGYCFPSCLPAHPHSRGENFADHHTSDGLGGSSPLTRGKRGRERCDEGQNGLIPTHAGKTARRVGRNSADRAHPHSRGENRVGWGPLRGREGSSPLTRGKPPSNYLSTRPSGLIPTHAGKTYRTRWRRAKQGAHPHSRGENRHRRHELLDIRGSSPLTRGKRARACVRQWL